MREQQQMLLTVAAPLGGSGSHRSSASRLTPVCSDRPVSSVPLAPSSQLLLARRANNEMTTLTAQQQMHTFSQRTIDTRVDAKTVVDELLNEELFASGSGYLTSGALPPPFAAAADATVDDLNGDFGGLTLFITRDGQAKVGDASTPLNDAIVMRVDVDETAVNAPSDTGSR